MPSKYADPHGNRGGDHAFGYQPPFANPALPKNRPSAGKGRSQDDSASSSSSSEESKLSLHEECNVSQNTMSPPRRSEANTQQSGPDLYKLNHKMQQQLHSLDPQQRPASYPHNSVTHSLVTSTVKQNP